MADINELTERLGVLVAQAEENAAALQSEREALVADREQMQRISEAILETNRDLHRERVSDRIEHGSGIRVQSGLYAGMTAVELAMSEALLRAGEETVRTNKPVIKAGDIEPWRRNLQSATEELLKIHGQALDPDVAGAGAELVTTELSNTLWNDVHLATQVASLFDRINMPSSPFQIPLEFGDSVWYRGESGVAGPTHTPGTNRRSIEAEVLKSITNWNYELDEESVVAVLPLQRANMIRGAAETMDDVLVNGDTRDSGGATGNVNAGGAASGYLNGRAGYDHFLRFDGLVKRALIDAPNSQDIQINGAITADGLNSIRASLGKYGLRTGEVVFVVDISTYYNMLRLEEVRTLDKLGPQATVLTGQLAAFEGVPIIVSEQLLRGNAAGVVPAGGGGTRGRILAFNRRQFITGFIRDIMIETEREITRLQNTMVASFRMGFLGRALPSADGAVSLGYDIA